MQSRRFDGRKRDYGSSSRSCRFSYLSTRKTHRLGLRYFAKDPTIFNRFFHMVEVGGAIVEKTASLNAPALFS